MNSWIDTWVETRQSLNESGLAEVLAQPPQAVISALRQWLRGRT